MCLCWRLAVDEQGGEKCSAEVDKVSVNGQTIGTLTGNNNQWSDVFLTVPVDALSSGRNRFAVAIDTTGTGCWAVEVDFAEVEIPFNIGAVSVQAKDDVDIRRGSSGNVIPDKVWETGFDANGKIKPPSVNDPIADAVKGGWFGRGVGQFKYGFSIDMWPNDARPDWEPRIDYKWDIEGTGVTSGGFQALKSTGWDGSFNVTVPSKVGKYRLNVVLKIYRDQDLLQTEQRVHDLYVVLGRPKSGCGCQLIHARRRLPGWTWRSNGVQLVRHPRGRSWRHSTPKSTAIKGSGPM